MISSDDYLHIQFLVTPKFLFSNDIIQAINKSDIKNLKFNYLEILVIIEKSQTSSEMKTNTYTYVCV